MKRTVRISLLQLPAKVAGKSFRERQKRNLETVVEMLAIAGKRGSDLALRDQFPDQCISRLASTLDPENPSG